VKNLLLILACVVLGVGGGIAAYKSCELLRRLTEAGHRVRVVPTAAALRPDCMPRRQPASATTTPNTELLAIPMTKSVTWTAPLVCWKYWDGERPSIPMPTMRPSKDKVLRLLPCR